jgi:ubiquinone/menaquinone biosynthesis C-methylase UbiE
MSDDLRTNYEVIAPRYDEHREQWAIPRDDLLASLAEGGPVTAVDVGCGTGLYLTNQQRLLAGLPIRWIGMDPSAGMLAAATAKEGRASFLQGVVESLPFADASMDYVHSSFTFHHFRDKEAALDEMRRVLRPGGCVSIHNVEPWSMDGWWVYEFFPRTREIDEQRFWPVDRLVSALRARGLDTDAAIDTSDRELRLGDILAESESRTISQLAVLDDASYEAGLGALRAAADPDPNATIRRESATVRVTARAPAS